MNWLKVLVLLCGIGLLLWTYQTETSQHGKRLLERRSGFLVTLWAKDGQGIRPPFELLPSTESHGSEEYYLHVSERELNSSGTEALDSKPVYSFSVESGGEYSLWAHTRWKHVCANSLAVSIDEGGPLLVGNEELFGRWHWVRCDIPLELEPGEHELRIEYAERGVDIERFLIAESDDPRLWGSGLTWRAAEHEGELEDIFELHPIAPWRLQSRESVDGGVLVFPQEDASLIAVTNEFSEPFFLSTRFRWLDGPTRNRQVGLIWDYHDSDHNKQLRIGSHSAWQLVRNRGREQRTARVQSEQGSFFDLAGKRYLDLELSVQRDRVRLWVDGQSLGMGGLEPGGRGRVGVFSNGGHVGIERLECHRIQDPAMFHSFPYDIRSMNEVVGFNIVSGQWSRNYYYSAPFFQALEVHAWGGRAVITTGERWWTELRQSVVLRARPGVRSGLILGYRDPEHYTFVGILSYGDSEAEIQLVEHERGKDRVLEKRPVRISPWAWTLIEVEVTPSRLNALINQREVLAAKRSSVPGQVGLMTEIVSRHPGSLNRVPALRLEDRSSADFSTRAAMKMNDRGKGDKLLFHYRDPSNFYYFGVIQPPQTGSSYFALGRFVNGRHEIFHREAFTSTLDSGLKVKRVSPSGTYLLELKSQGGMVTARLNEKLFAALPNPVSESGRIGFLSGMPAAHAEFDEYLVEPVAETASRERSDEREFSFTTQPARSLVPWQAKLGEWGLGIKQGPGIRSLIGRVGLPDLRAELSLPSTEIPGVQGFSVDFLPEEPLSTQLFFRVKGKRGTGSESDSSFAVALDWKAGADEQNVQARIQVHGRMAEERLELARIPVVIGEYGRLKARWTAGVLRLYWNDVLVGETPCRDWESNSSFAIEILGRDGDWVAFRRIAFDIDAQ